MELSDLLRSVVSVFEGLELPYFVTGSMATIAYGEPRQCVMREQLVRDFCVSSARTA
jgi:hypothetical protein